MPARDAVVRLLCSPSDRPHWELAPVDEGLQALPFVSQDTLAALQEINLPIGTVKPATVEAAVRQAHALRRAWDLGTVNLEESGAVEVSALATCTTLHTIYLDNCEKVTDVSR